MRDVLIVTDSTADLSEKMLDKYHIKSIPLYVLFGDDAYKDGVDIDTRALYDKVDDLGFLPKTQAVSPGDFIDFF